MRVLEEMSIDFWKIHELWKDEMHKGKEKYKKGEMKRKTRKQLKTQNHKKTTVPGLEDEKENRLHSPTNKSASPIVLLASNYPIQIVF